MRELVQTTTLLEGMDELWLESRWRMRLLNASEEAAEAVIGPGLLAIGRAQRTDLFGGAGQPLPVGEDGAVRLGVPARRQATVRLWLEPGAAVGAAPGS